MAARIVGEMTVGVTPEIAAAVKIASELCGIKPSQYARLALSQKLISEGFLPHPLARKSENSAAG